MIAAGTRLSIFDVETIQLKGGPLDCYVVQGIRYTIMISSDRKFDETFEIEINDGSNATWFDDGWRHVATVYGRVNMWEIVDAYLSSATV